MLINDNLTKKLDIIQYTITNASNDSSDGWVRRFCDVGKKSEKYKPISFDLNAGIEGAFYGYKNVTTVIGNRYTKNTIWFLLYDISSDTIRVKAAYI